MNISTGQLWIRTIFFALTQMLCNYGLYIWVYWVKLHFLAEHPFGEGVALAQYTWEYAWCGLLVGALLVCLLSVFHIRRSLFFYDLTFYGGLFLLIAWVIFATIAMEIIFVPWTDPRGAHY